MKKIYASLVLSFALSAPAIGQTFAFFRNGVQLANDTEITINEYITEDGVVSLESGLEIHNLLAFPMQGVAAQEVIKAPESGSLSFCFGNCVLTNSNKSLETSVATTNTTSFHVLLATETNAFATSKVKYSVYPKINSSDIQSITVNYVYNSTSTQNTKSDLAKVILNQSNGIYNVYYSFGSVKERKIQLMNLTGQVVAQSVIQKQSGTWIPDCTMTKGIYIVAVRENGKVTFSRKLVVR